MNSPIRHKIHHAFVGISALTVLVSSLAHAEEGLPSIIVAPIDNGMSQALSIWQPAIGEGLAEMLITELTKLHKFKVLESTALDDLRAEMKLGDEGWVKLDEKVNKGEWAGADYMFRGKVTRFGENTESFGGSRSFLPIPGGFGVNKKKSEVQIDWRIVDVARREVVASGRASGKHAGTSWNFSGPRGGGNFSTEEFRDSALGKATMDAIKEIITEVKTVSVSTSGRQTLIHQKEEKIRKEEEAKLAAARRTPGTVTGVSTAGFVFVSLGSNHGLKKGDKVKVYEMVEDKDESGKVLFTEEKLAGELILESVAEDKSKASCVGDLKPKTGWLVKSL